MIYLIPDYSVNYHGVWHSAGEKFEILPADEAELSQHGKIIKTEEAVVSEAPQSGEAAEAEKKTPAKRKK